MSTPLATIFLIISIFLNNVLAYSITNQSITNILEHTTDNNNNVRFEEFVTSGNIKSNGSLILNANNDINIIGSILNSKDDTIIQSENGNINIVTEQIHNKIESKQGENHYFKDESIKK